MSTNKIELAVSPRNSGRGSSRDLRRSGFVPAIVYGKGFENKNISLDNRLVTKYCGREFESTLFTLKCAEDSSLDGKAVLIKEIRRHPSSRKFQHVDFYAVDMAQTVRVNIELKYDGTAAGVKEGGNFQIMLREVEIETMPGNIPDALTIDISGLSVGDTLHVSNIPLPSGCKFITSETQAICTVTGASAEPEAGAEGNDAAAAAAEPTES